MKCRQCEWDNPAGSRFCSACGTQLHVACPQCQQPCQPDAPACIWCGAPLGQTHTPRTDTVERKQATVLFVDIVNSTKMIAGLDAEGAMQRLRPVIAALSQAARRFDGTILRSLGDGLKIAFGAPRALEGHATLACQAAIAMQKALRTIENAPAVRIGLHSGEVVAGDIDTGFSVEPAAQGLTVHIASRMEQLAEPGEICISDDCYQLVRAVCDTVPMGVQTLKGVPKPMLVHKLIGLRPAISSEQFRNVALTPFRSRDAELDMLDQALAEAIQGKPPVVGIAADAGVGKSRLCYEFGERCRRRVIPILEARCFVHGQAMPMLPIIEMLRSYFRLLPRDTIADARQKVQQQLRTLDPALLREDWILFSVLGLRQDTDPPMPTEPLMARSRLRAVLADIVKAAGREPGVIIFDDLHWLDPVSGGLLEAMIEATAGTHILVVLNFRPSFRAGWMQTQRYRHLELNEMGFSGSDTLVTDLIGNAAELRPVRSQVAARCAGNPFFAEELVRSLVETGILAGSPGAYRIGTATSEISLPPTVEAVIGARLDRLSEPAKTLLQLCATIGKEFPISLLREITGQSSHEIEQTLSQLQAADIVQERPGPLGRSFGFRHPMFQEVAYATQLRTRRRELHADVARAIETFPWGKMDEFAGLLAHHCEAAGEAMAAARHLQRSAHWIGRTDSSQALQQWKKVCALLVDAPSSATNRRLLAQASSQVLNYGWREGITVTEAKPYADQAVSYARETNDTVHGPLLLATYGRILAATGAADEYVTLSREALSMRANDIDVTRDAMLHGTHAQALWLSGRPRDALRMVEAGLALFASSTPRTEREESEFEAFRRSGFDPKHWLHAQKARFYVWLGRFKEAEAAIALMELMETTFGEVAVVKFIPHLAAAELGFWQQSAPLAQRHATLLTDYAERLRLPYLRVAALFADGLAASAAADFDTAIVSMQKALSFARHSNAGLEFEPLLLSAIAGATLQAGAALKAATLAADAMKIGQQRTNRIAECQASLVWASTLLHDGSQNAIARARPLLARAEELIDASGAVVFEPMAIHVRTRLEALY